MSLYPPTSRPNGRPESDLRSTHQRNTYVPRTEYSTKKPFADAVPLRRMDGGLKVKTKPSLQPPPSLSTRPYVQRPHLPPQKPKIPRPVDSRVPDATEATRANPSSPFPGFWSAKLRPWRSLIRCAKSAFGQADRPLTPDLTIPLPSFRVDPKSVFAGVAVKL